MSLFNNSMVKLRWLVLHKKLSGMAVVLARSGGSSSLPLLSERKAV